MLQSTGEKIFFPPEWHAQDAVMLTWPHIDTDWAPILPEVVKTYQEVAREILKYERLIIVCQEPETVISLFSDSEQKKMRVLRISCNDTWARDHGPVCTYHQGIPVINDFRFNGWGNKFDATLDDLINKELYEKHVFSKDAVFVSHKEFILEGGSIETDGNQTILTTTECLLNPNRNRFYEKQEIEDFLKSHLGAVQILWLHHGHLAGDDTDSHIDTLARFCSEDTLCYVKTDDPHDEHFEALQNMEKELRTFRNIIGEPYRLVPLPLPGPVYNTAGERLPVTYANFLILNDAVLVPLYGLPEDLQALAALKKVFTDRTVVGINCLSLVEQNGSLHCITMQIPKGFLR